SYFFCVLFGLSFCIFFFFSSRRRHTRWPRDWSSDVCSSDLAVVEDALVLAVGGAIAVLDRDDRHDLPGPLDLTHRDLRQAHVADFPLFLKPPKRAKLVGEGHFRIDAVQLVEVDALELEQAQAAVARRAEV